MELRRAGTPVSSAITVEFGHMGRPSRLRGIRNDVPLTVPYRWRARPYPAAVRAIKTAEARYGKPRPVCSGCQAPLSHLRAALYGRCERCGTV